MFPKKVIIQHFSQNGKVAEISKDLNDELEAQRLQKILDLFLRNYKQEDIAKEIGLSLGSINEKIKKIQHFLEDFSENPDSEIPKIYQEIAKKWQEISEFKPFLYNIWNLKKKEMRGLFLNILKQK
jgi:predicted transcriptional regulator